MKTPKEIIEQHWPEAFGLNHWQFTMVEHCIERYAEQLSKHGWISVEDRLPDLAEDVFVCVHKCNTRYPDTLIGYVNDVTKKWDVVTTDGLIEDFNNNPDYYSVTHWQPLPKPPVVTKNQMTSKE